MPENLNEQTLERTLSLLREAMDRRKGNFMSRILANYVSSEGSRTDD